MTNNEMPSLGELIRRKGGWMIDKALTERLGVTVVDGRKVADGDVIKTICGRESRWLDDVIVIGADVPEDVKVFVAYHEYKHYLDYIGRGVVPSNEHSSVRSSRIEKVCDLYAIRRVVREMGVSAVEKAIEWMVNYHFQWDLEHPDDPSDLLYRAVFLYRFSRRNGLSIDTTVDMEKLQKSQRWWR